jgi:hypothetical protein
MTQASRTDPTTAAGALTEAQQSHELAWLIADGISVEDHPVDHRLTRVGCEGCDFIEGVVSSARTSALREARAAVAAIRPPDRFVAMDGSWEQGLSEAAVLAALEALESKP